MSSSPSPGPTETPAAGEPAPEATGTPTAEKAASSGERWEWNQERYRDGVFSHAVATERERLTLLESVLDHHTRARFEALGLTTGHRVLEVGGGGGSVGYDARGRIGYDARFQRIRGGDDEARWWQLTLEQTREAVVAEGLATDEEFAAAYADLDDPSFHDLSLAVFTAWGVKESGG
ncbi:SPOR domain-containing protein [Streptomyces sp. MBT61]|uniref:SPOR domain-containing protein n=1 Tax=Streptomyces sp. MBT61 TaxID=1488392 RepID=UPI00190DFBCC|nr:hypothetical protein [Streptomyces sp. MBT61]MBK3552408.1 hypothetical protein [Streptomyces sp. MBT61]